MPRSIQIPLPPNGSRCGHACGWPMSMARMPFRRCFNAAWRKGSSTECLAWDGKSSCPFTSVLSGTTLVFRRTSLSFCQACYTQSFQRANSPVPGHVEPDVVPHSHDFPLVDIILLLEVTIPAFLAFLPVVLVEDV